jgi:hypothetical protein
MKNEKSAKQALEGANKAEGMRTRTKSIKTAPRCQKAGARACSVTEVPPYCFLKPGMSPEEAACAAVRELGIVTEIDAIAILWELQRAAKAERPSAENAEEVHATPGVLTDSRCAAHNLTHKCLIKRAP